MRQRHLLPAALTVEHTKPAATPPCRLHATALPRCLPITAVGADGFTQPVNITRPATNGTAPANGTAPGNGTQTTGAGALPGAALPL